MERTSRSGKSFNRKRGSRILKTRKEPIVSIRPNAARESNGDVFDSRTEKIATPLKYKEKPQNLNQLYGKFTKLQREYNSVKQERDRLQKCCKVINSQICEQKRKIIVLHQKIQMMQSYQADPIMHLQQKLRNLVLKSKIQKVASTQTEAITGELQTRSNSQSMEEIMKEKAEILLRQPDMLLTAFITELEKEKHSVQNDNKYARIQFEKRMKDDMKLEIQYLKEEHQRQLHSMALLHTTEIKEQESAYKEDVKRLQGRIEYLQNDLATTRALNDLISHQLEESREKEGKSAGALGRAEQEILELKRDVTSLAEYRRNYQLDVDAENLKKEIEKYKEINEIVMSEFTKVERERDELLSEFNKNLNRIEQVNIRKHKEIKSRIHEIKRKYSLDEYAFGT